MIVLFRVALLLTVMAFSYHLYKVLYRKNVIEKMVNDFETNYQKRQELEEKIRREEGNVIKKGFIHHIDMMIERSRLRKKIPFLTTELYLVISIIVGLACFILSKLFIQFWNDFETNYQKRQELEEKIRREEGNVIKKGFIHHIDMMIERSRLRKKIPFLTTELYLVISVIVGLTCFILSKLFIQFWVINVLIGIIAVFGMYLVIYYSSGFNFEKIDDQIIIAVFGMYLVIYYSSGFNFEKIDDQIITLINDIENFSNVSNDIVTIFENVADYLDDPLDEYFMEFVQYSRETGDIEGAFKNIEGKLENEKLQNLFKNLEIASRNRANYKELMKEARR